MHWVVVLRIFNIQLDQIFEQNFLCPLRLSVIIKALYFLSSAGRREVVWESVEGAEAAGDPGEHRRALKMTSGLMPVRYWSRSSPDCVSYSHDLWKQQCGLCWELISCFHWSCFLSAAQWAGSEPREARVLTEPEWLLTLLIKVAEQQCIPH